jgi:putative sigma-54 modulation protein
MKITITSRHYDLSPTLKEYAEGKIENLTTYFENLSKAHVVFGLEKYRHFVEVTLHSNGKNFYSKEESDDMYISVDRVADRLERQILKHKGKRFGKKTPRLSEMEVALPVVEPQASPEPESDIVSVDATEFPVLTPDEAAGTLEDKGKEFVVFANKETNRINVLVKRDDGTYGLIEARENAEEGAEG